MAFFYQLRLLLWKNFTLKRRSPFVVLFELFIPLVLFVILWLIRKKLPANPIGTQKFPAMPLPSSGMVSFMQMFCEGGQRDDRGFMDYSKTGTTQKFLSQLQTVAQHNNFFNPGFTPDEMDDLPTMYESVIDDPAFFHDIFENATDLQLRKIVKNVKVVSDFLEYNLSLPTDEVNALLDSEIHVKEIYDYFVDDDISNLTKHLVRIRRDADLPDSLSQEIAAKLSKEALKKILSKLGDSSMGGTSMLSSILDNMPDGFMESLPDDLKESIIKEIMEHPDLITHPKTTTIVQAVIEIIEKSKNSIILNPKQIAQLMKIFIFSPDKLKALSCDKKLFLKLAVSNTKDGQIKLRKLQQNMCNLSRHDFVELSDFLKSHITNDDIIKFLDLKSVNLTATVNKVEDFIHNVDKFVQFQTELEQLATLVEMLPVDQFDKKNDTEIVTPSPSNSSINSNNTATDNPDVIKPPVHPKPSKHGLLKVWSFMQIAVCGKKPKNSDHPFDPTDIDSVPLTSRQQRMLGIIVHILYSNPKVLYAPVNTSADDVIVKANATFAFIDLIGVYADKWLNVSVELREYLEKPQTAKNLQLMRNMQTVLKMHKGIVGRFIDSEKLSTFMNDKIPTVQEYLHMLDVIDHAANMWLGMTEGISLNVFQGFETEADMVDYFLTKAYRNNDSVIAGVVFENIEKDGGLPPHVKYKIRQNATFTPTTKYTRKQTWFPGPGPSTHPYYQFGFVWIQDIIERAIIDVQVGRDVIEPGTFAQQFPYPCFVYDQFMFMIEHVMPLCLTISWVYSVAMLVQSIVYEKEQRLKEVMKMMGLSNAVHWFAWFISYWIQMTITVIILTMMLKFGHVLAHSSGWLIFVVLELYVVAVISFSFLISVLYSKAKVAAACAGIIYFLSYVPYMYIAIKEDIAGDRMPGVFKSIACLFSTTAFGLGAKYFAFYEEMGVGVQWDNFYISPVEDDEFNLFIVMLMMILDCFIYFFLVWYIEHVYPGSYGLPKPWYFPFTKSYWCGGSLKPAEDCASILDLCKKGSTYLSIIEDDQAGAMAGNPDDGYKFEQEPLHLNRGVHIENLTKVYKLGKKMAVNKLSLNLYEGQITSFLGHNGAGKTTTMSILSGLIPPTSGYATIYDLDIRTDMDVIRQSLGMCPQHNVLFDRLTVNEHLWFYASLKGMKPEDIQAETDRMIEDLGLPNKRHSNVDCLSGGMQRKLSVAIAFVGGSRTVILDEPTAGVDPYARRAIWDLLVQYKENRTILLSTHHMDEADILGDRIAIISNGQMKCCGSSIFLKNNIGEGYHLALVKSDNNTEEIEEQTTVHNGVPRQPTSPCDESKVTDFIRKYIPSAYLVSENTRELHYILPFEEAKKGNFEKFFQVCESGVEHLYIDSMGVMDTTLEEVFLKVTEAACLEEEKLKEDKQLEEIITRDESTHPINPSDIDAHATNQNNLNELLLPDDDDDELLSDGMATGGVKENPDVDILELGAMAAGGEDTPSNRKYPKIYSKYEQDDKNTPRVLLEGRGSRMLSKKLLLLNQFRAVLVKRCRYIMRNWRSLFSQIILPAIFVAVAMTVALAAPSVDDAPPIVLNPSQYYNITQPHGNFVPFTNERFYRQGRELDAGPEKLINTLHYPSGLGATCVLRSAHNSSFDTDLLRDNNFDYKTFELLSRYYNEECQQVFTSGLHLDSYIPDAISPTSSTKINFTEPDTPLGPSYSSSHYYPSCQCLKDGSGFICSRAYHPNPPSFRVVSKDILQNITGQHTEDYLLYTTYDYRLHRYGALSFGLEQECIPENFGEKAPTLFKKLAVRKLAKYWFNHKGYHSMPVFLNSINNAILRANLPRSAGNPSAYGITAVNHPWNQTNNELSTLNYIMQGTDVLIAIFIIVAMSFVPASFVVFLVYEKSTKAKHLQFVTGINPVVYWLGNYIWDICNYVIPAFMCILILIIFQIPAYVSEDNLPAVIALFLMYGWSMTPVMYPASFIFNEPSTAYIFLIVINLFTGITCIITSFLLELFSYDKDLERVHNVLKYVLMMFPNYCLGRGLMDLAFNEYKNEYYFKTGQYDMMMSPLKWGLVTSHLVAMACIGLLFFIITLLCEYSFFFKPRRQKVSNSPIHDEDVDVATERKRVLKGNGRYDLLRLENLTKVYRTSKLGNHVAVDRVCLGVPPGECFGLLGVNGAGKTTTFKMLTGDLPPTAGTAYLNGYSIVKDIKKIQESIGYCPQFDSLYDELTAKEHLQFYSRLRGIPPKDEQQVVSWALKKLGLVEYANKLSGTYSGGNKRKLSTAIALIGHPPVIFMDEPTTGMDPHSRRFLWDLILNLIQDGRSVILTSHSMEECEALCSRLVIMVNGKFKCLGSIQHLKNKYGEGYTFSIRIKGPDFERNQRNVQRFIERKMPDACLKEQHYNLLQYELKTANVSLSYLFSILEEAEQDLAVEDYSVSQNTLDNVFINFVKQQMEIVEEEAPKDLSNCDYLDDSLETRPLIHDSSLSDDEDDDDMMLRLDDSSGTQLTPLLVIND
ncbi:ATP-binding cassette sub-family A member 2 [Patella vulgata]|uniref:ATP-binding cassette sub-family A member 2 n=1 Tax=Patella vulgata TaxID=6465 RepID=UPI00217F6800|nr:ATP-binding cassette sub-family A member 2 [Patella vulgata]